MGRNRVPRLATDFIGVDMGIANLAADSDGDEHGGEDVDKVRRKHNLQRKPYFTPQRSSLASWTAIGHTD